MSDVITIGNVSEQVQKFWGPIVYDQLREHTHLVGLVSKDYSGQIQAQGDTVHITQIQKAVGQSRTIGTNADIYESEKLNKSRISLQITKRFTVAYEFEDLVEVLSQIQMQSSPIRESMNVAIQERIQEYLESFISPSAATPDHTKTGVTDFNQAELVTLRKLAGAAKWPVNKAWYCLVDPSYYSDILNVTNMISSDVVDDRPAHSGQLGIRRFGFNILEDNSKVTDTALAFHPDFIQFVMGAPEFKISDLHPVGKFGYAMTLSVLGGAVAGFDSSVLHATVTS